MPPLRALHPLSVLRPKRLPHRPLPRFHSTSPQNERITRILSRLPKFLHPYTNGLRSAPVSHVVSFLILHEITAIVPLVGLAGVFHYCEWLPKGWSEASYINDGVEKFGRYFRRKGWFGFSREHEEGEIQVKEGVSEGFVADIEVKGSGNGNGTRILVEVATAYAITKVLLPARIILSVWATPWFARVAVGRFGRIFKRAGGKATTNGTMPNSKGS
ncbi:hypothetical protein HYALB_00006847 [Hymenoscyphus albidus]|uniref:Uncharacterized protein n=1 Tax=Hymenoscyphus albidus TaxID=595503 RepID=A0A9N9LCH6_9HELO|nr:hypothetical protein HYALB_00006847 [Hymenoscyphus albidus]